MPPPPSSAAITPLYLKTNKTPLQNDTNNALNNSLPSTASADMNRTRAKSNPIYQTSNQAYGAKPVTEIHKPSAYHGSSHFFTREFVGGMYRNRSLNCNKTRNPAVADPTFGSNHYHE